MILSGAALAAQAAWTPKEYPQPRLEAFCTRLLEHSRYALKNRVLVRVVAEDSRRGVGTSPAGTLAPHQGWNTSDAPLLWVAPAIFMRARDEAEAAFILAHEIGHLEALHYEKYRDAYCALFDQWAKTHGKRSCAARTRDDEADFWDRSPGARAKLEELAQEEEEEADRRGVELMSAAGFDAQAALGVLGRSQKPVRLKALRAYLARLPN